MRFVKIPINVLKAQMRENKDCIDGIFNTRHYENTFIKKSGKTHLQCVKEHLIIIRSLEFGIEVLENH